MIILYILISVLAIIILLLALALYHINKKLLNDYDKKLILFVIDMYLSYGESIDVFPNNNAKEILLLKIKEVKEKIENDTNYRKTNKKNKS
jgi:predicted nucleotidyltransferase